MRRALPAALLLAACALPAAAAPEAPPAAPQVVRVPAADPALDRNRDGFADVLVDGRTAHHDADFDGRFDYSLTLAFKEYDTDGHVRYISGGYSRDVFAELTRAGLDKLCASERVAADWTAAHFREFLYYRNGYGRLSLLDGSAENDGRLASAKPRPRHEYVVTFNPDGTVQEVRRGDRAVTLATFDYGTNVAIGPILRLPPIDGIADLARIRAELERLF